MRSGSGIVPAAGASSPARATPIDHAVVRQPIGAGNSGQPDAATFAARNGARSPRPRAAQIEARVAASAAVQAHLTANAYALPFFEEPQVYGVQQAVEGFDTESVGRPSFADVWLQG